MKAEDRRQKACGLLENLDVALGLTRLNQRVTENGAVTEDSSGMADSTIELKWRFYDANGLSFALKPGVLWDVSRRRDVPLVAARFCVPRRQRTRSKGRVPWASPVAKS